jgi:hypothetical protein
MTYYCFRMPVFLSDTMKIEISSLAKILQIIILLAFWQSPDSSQEMALLGFIFRGAILFY